VLCRTIYLHCQICWNLHVTRIALIILNIIGWLIPAILLGVAIAVAQITYTMSNHCSIRVDWVVNLLIIPIIIEIGLAILVQLTTFLFCVNVYLKSLKEPPPPTNDSFGDAIATSTYSTGSRYPYRKAVARINKVIIFLSLAYLVGS
jgi:7 transmembrane receptor (Secretin family)